MMTKKPKGGISSGLRFRKLDLHVHTPASKDDYGKKSASESEIVDAAIASGMDGICVTDHNTAEWVDKVAEAAKGKPLVVFPGFEVSVTGGKEGSVHIIGIFDPRRTSEELNDVLADMGLTAAKRGKTKELANGDPSLVIGAIARHGGLPVLAHADSSHGVMHDMKGQARIRVVRNEELAAAEVSSDKYRRFLDGTDPAYRRSLSTYEASDAHTPKEIGSKFSYFKVQDLTVAGLRQCFYDHEVRIRLADQYQPVSVPRILSVAISQGFFDGETVRFHASLNTLVGGQGVGKSLLIEFIRFTLDQLSVIDLVSADTEEKLSERLGLGGHVDVVVELPNGPTYEVSRLYDGDRNPLEVTNLDTGEEIKGDISSLFPIMAYSQTEAIYISRDPHAQRRLIDRFIDAPKFERDIAKTQTELQKNGRKFTKVLGAKDELVSIEKEISTVDEEIRILEKSLKSPVFNEMKAADQQKAGFDVELGYHDELASEIEDFVDELSISQKPPALSKPLKKIVLLKKGNDISRSSLKLLREGLAASRDKIKENRAAVEILLKQWSPTHEEVRSRYEALLEEVGGDQKRLEIKRKKLLDRKGELEKKAKTLRTRSARLNKLLKSRNDLLNRLDEIRQAFFEARGRQYDELTALSEGKLQLDITQASDPEEFATALKEMATGTHIRKADLDRIASKVAPREFIDLFIRNETDLLATKGDVTKQTVERLFAWLGALPAQEDVLSLQHQYLPHDVPSIRFRKEDDQYYPLSGLSTGQKCTALLIIALSTGQPPIIVDQPEEAIDIAFVYSDIVSKLRFGKEHRQFILTTHNPNIAVTADSDLLLVLKSTASRGRVVHTGAIEDDDVRAEAIQHLEGGEKPYLLRGKKYGLIDGGGKKG